MYNKQGLFRKKITLFNKTTFTFLEKNSNPKLGFRKKPIIGKKLRPLPLKSKLAGLHAPMEPVRDKWEQQDQILIIFKLKYEDINRKMNH